MSSTPARRLVADLGGTHARFALADAAGEVQMERVMDASQYASPADAARAYLAQCGVDAAPEEAVFAVAAPISDDEVQFTNSRWRFSVGELKRRLGLARLRVINDFEAVAWSLPKLEARDLRQIGEGHVVPNAPRGAIGPGTGLGVSGLAPAGDGWTAIASEAGHCSFAPQNDLEIEILRILRRRFGHVSDERLVSGPGLVNLHDAIAELRGAPRRTLAPEDVTERAARGDDSICVEAVRCFTAVLGSAAGNLALTLGARGGIYIGGIVPSIGAAFDAALFRERFVAKGRLRSYLEKVPTFLILREHPALLGAAQAAI